MREFGEVTAVKDENVGTTLASDASAGDDVLTVEDTLDFDTATGTLLVGETEQIDWDSVDADAGTIHLADVLAGDWDAGTLVELYPVKSRRVAFVKVNVEIDENGDGLPARVPNFLHDRLPAGVRDADDAEMVAVEPHGDVWWVEDILGQDPVIDAAFLLDGSLDITPFASDIRPVAIFDDFASLPALPDADYPIGARATTRDTAKLYKNKDDATWDPTFDAADIDGEITSTHIADDAITTPKLAANAVTAAKIAAHTITAAEIAADTITASEIAAGAISTSELAALAVTAAKIAANTITAAQIAAGTITATEIAAATITGAKIAAGTITASNIVADTITANEIAAGAISTSELAANAVTAAKIAAGTITATEIAAATITGAKIAAATITASNIVADTLTANEIAAGAISTSELAANAVTAAKIAAGTITATEIAAATITGAKIAATTITASNIAADTITANEIAANAISTSELAANAVTAAKIAAGTITADKLNVTSLDAITATLGTITSGTLATVDMFSPTNSTASERLWYASSALTGGGLTSLGKWLMPAGVTNDRANAIGAMLFTKTSLAGNPHQWSIDLAETVSGVAQQTKITGSQGSFSLLATVGATSATLGFDYTGALTGITSLPPGVVSTTALAANAVTAAKIAAGTITNTEISSSAAIAYSKLNLTASIVSGDIVSLAGNKITGAVTGPTSITASTTVTATTGLTVGADTGNSIVVHLDSAAAKTRDIQWETAGVARWIMRVTSTAEGGSNAGSDWQLLARDDSGNAIVTALSIARSTGAVTFGSRYTTQVALDETASQTAANANVTVTLSANRSAVYTGSGGTVTIDQASFNTTGASFTRGMTGSGRASGASGTVIALAGATFDVRNTGAGTVTSAYGAYIDTPTNSGGGTITNAYGLYIADQNVGTNKWAIFTNAGKVHLGDVLELNKQFYPATPALATQSATAFFGGTGAPSNANGANGDYYLRSDAGAGTHLYFKTGGAWAAVV